MGDHGRVEVVDLGSMPYEAAYAEQQRQLEGVLAARAAGDEQGLGRILFVEHVPPVITVSRRPGSRDNLVASPERLAALGVTVAETDRGGDITYHGPGQLVAYPILDLNAFRLGLHEYMRLLEEAVIETCRRFNIAAGRDACATGVWVGAGGDAACGESGGAARGGAKICAMGVRVRRWVSMHGLALNVTTDLSHFGLIVPCGLPRPVTSLQRELGARCPEMGEVKRVLGAELAAQLATARERAQAHRARGADA